MWLYKIPFCDFGKVTDEPTADVTAHSLEALGALGTTRDAAESGLEWLLAEQEDDGSWFGRWGVNHLYGTGAALPGLEAMGVPPDHPAMRRAVAWLDSVQQENGGFGEDIRSYADPAWRGRARFTTASQTAWALLGYVAAGNAEDSSARRAADYLCAAQRPRRRLGRAALHRHGIPARFHDSLSPVPHHFPAVGTRTNERKVGWMKFPLASTVSIGKYVAAQQRKGQRYPLVLMLEPTLACNIACIGCGKIREYESNRARLSVEECIDAAVQCPAPVVSICGGEPLVYKGIDEVVAEVLELRQDDRALHERAAPRAVPRLVRAVEAADLRHPPRRDARDPRLRLRLPGPLGHRRRRDQERARARGFRVTTNTTIFKETEVGDVVEMMRYLTDEVGIDGMMIAPGYQYSQIDPALTMTRDEHEEKFRVIRAPREGARLPLDRVADLPGLPHRRSASSRARRGARSRATRTAGRARATC